MILKLRSVRGLLTNRNYFVIFTDMRENADLEPDSIIYIYIYIYIQGVPGGKDLTSGECSLGLTIPI